VSGLTAVETIAILSLTYRTMWRNCYSAPAALDDELQQYSDGCTGFAPTAPSGISLLGMIGSQSLEELDWELIEAMPTQLGDSFVDLASLGRDLAELSPERCEALLHAWPEDPRTVLASEPRAKPFLERWSEVAAVVSRLEPLSWDRERCDEMALAAAATGWWNDPEFEED
jgi:hypothetical protein